MSDIIEIAAGEVAAELQRRGIGAHERVMLQILPTPEIVPGRREARARVVRAGLLDADIDWLIKEAQREADAHLG